MMLLRLLLIDPHDKFRESARNYLLRCCKFRSVEAVASYDEVLLLNVQHFPDLILVDSDYLSKSPLLVTEFEKIKNSKPSLDVLALSLFRDDDHNRYQIFSPLVSGFIFKESFSVNLFDYLASRHDGLTGKQTGSREGDG